MKWLALPLLASAAVVGGPAALSTWRAPGCGSFAGFRTVSRAGCASATSRLWPDRASAAPCARNLVSSEIASAVFDYRCRAGDFGQSKLIVLTPRALTIETQGISGGLPFNYVVHARRIGDCPTL